MDIGEKIRILREKEELSQVAFAEETGINVRTLRKYENIPSTNISSTELLKITAHPRFTKYTLWLMTDDSEPDGDSYSDDENVFMKLIQSMSDDELEQVVEYMEFLISKQK